MSSCREGVPNLHRVSVGLNVAGRAAVCDGGTVFVTTRGVQGSPLLGPSPGSHGHMLHLTSSGADAHCDTIGLHT